MHIYRILPGAVVVLFMLIAFCPAPSSAESIRLPGLFAADDVLADMLQDATLPTELRLAATASGESNVGSLWSLTDSGQSPRRFTGSQGKADLQMGGWISLRSHDWLICYGQGMRERYSGNHDAAQLWIDLHADGQTQPRYAPIVNSDRIALSWYGIGRRAHFHAGTVSGQGDLIVRALAAEDLLQRALIGDVAGDVFSGALKIRDADAGVTGRGWSVDTRLSLSLNKRWRARVTAEGLLGEITWTNLPVEDSYLTSPGVFTDVDGFLHQIGGVSGAAWRENVTLNIVPSYRVELLADTRPAFLCGASNQRGEPIKPMLGIAWLPTPRQALCLRLYPVEEAIEIGVFGPGWQLRIAGDEWIAGNPSDLNVTLAGTLGW